MLPHRHASEHHLCRSSTIATHPRTEVTGSARSPCRARVIVVGAVRVRSPTAHVALSVVLAWVDTLPGCHGVTLNDASIVDEGRAGTLVCGGAAMAPG